MFVGLKHPLAAGGHVAATLNFEKAACQSGIRCTRHGGLAWSYHAGDAGYAARCALSQVGGPIRRSCARDGVTMLWTPPQRKYRTSCLVIAVMAGGLLWPSAVTAQMTHDHPNTACADAGLACATTATPTFAPDGSLWLTWAAAGRISVARSPDRGRTFGPSVAVNESPQRLDSGPDERPKIAVDTRGRVAVAYAIFKDNAFNGQVLYSRSDDGGKSFASPRAITSDRDSQRFEAIAFDPAGNLFAAWLDKRDRRPAVRAGPRLYRRGARFRLVKRRRHKLWRHSHRQGQHL